MKNIIVQVIWESAELDVLLAEEMEIAKLDDKPFTRQKVRTHLLQSANGRFRLFDFQALMPDKQFVLDEWREEGSEFLFSKLMKEAA